MFRRRELDAWQVSEGTLQALLRRGHWTRIRHGIYVDVDDVTGVTAAELHKVHVAAAILATEEPAFAFGPSAALFHDLPLPFDAPEDVHVLRESRQDLRSLARPSRHPVALPRMRIASHDGATADTGLIDGVPCVSPLIAAVTTAPMVSFTRKVGLFDAVMWDGTVDAEQVARCIVEWAHLGGSAASLDALAQARRGAQTYFETLSRLALVRCGIPEPELQVPIHDEAGLVGVVDMLWAHYRVIGEADGAIKYASRQDLLDEKRREDRLRACGFAVVRWMWDEIVESPEVVSARIRRAMMRAA